MLITSRADLSLDEVEQISILIHGLRYLLAATPCERCEADERGPKCWRGGREWGCRDRFVVDAVAELQREAWMFKKPRGINGEGKAGIRLHKCTETFAAI
jgi:hypothetical protein